jgi:hypothetical protein
VKARAPLSASSTKSVWILGEINSRQGFETTPYL